MRVLSLLLVITAVLGPRRANAACDPVTCAAMNSNTTCNTSTWSCQTIAYSGVFCIPSTYMLPPVGTACETDNNACTTDACGGTAGQTSGDGICHHNAVADGTSCGTNKICSAGACTCAAGTKTCGATCIPTASCCTNADCAVPANGSGVCSGTGGYCSITCTTGYKVCGIACIPNAMCCTNSDCPNDPANHRSGVCAASGCAYACDSGYKACGGTCIPNAMCCTNSDCVTPLNACYKAIGTCSAGACSYALNDGAACNADNDACTPNDKCANGACVADSANLVKCVQRPCHTAPSCNHSTGNCDDTALGNGATCGGDGCAAPGTCTAATCSSPPTDCSSKTSDCGVGICDPALASVDKCSTTNKLNGTACTLADKCQQMTSCSGGVCVGTPKVCTSPGPCFLSVCNPSTGDCDETQASVGSACDSEATACTRNAACDATGLCTGLLLPDGTPCNKEGCTESAACVAGSCICLMSADFGAGVPSDGGEGKSDHGCSVGGTSPAPLSFIFVLLLILYRARTRARARFL